ncbi:MAG: IPT/TIG domain-containing protein [Planctomycetes bacterium]|nr:IPT/TIG domain-containing protein [Planctomycetota bacterium]
MFRIAVALLVSLFSANLMAQAGTVLTGTIDAADLQQDGRIFRDGIASIASSPKAYPGLFNAGTNYSYDVYTINNTSATPIQVQLVFFNTSANSIHVSVHSTTYDPNNQGTGYLGDCGASSLNSILEGLSCTVPASTNYDIAVFNATAGAYGDYTITVYESAPNNAPVLDNSGSPALTAIAQDLPDGSNAGDTIGAIIATGASGDPITDPDTGAVEGLGITAVDTTNGTWEFTIDGGANWSTVTIPTSNALLLADNANTSIRFRPNASFTGTQTAGITFRAWDQTQGLNGEMMQIYVDNGGAGNFGNVAALSLVEETADITVNAQATVTVTAITPSSGDVGGGQSVTISGTNFGASSTVTIGGTAATGVTVDSATSISCTTPAGSLGTASVEVTSNGSTNAANTLYTYVVGTPEIAVLRDGLTNIADGSTESENNTGVASFAANYTIQNVGTATLNLTGGAGTEVVVAGLTNCTVLVTQPTTSAIGSSSSTTFSLQITPTAAGAFSFTVSMANDDADENPFNWTYSGNTAGGGSGGGGGGGDGGCSTDSSNGLSIFALLGILSVLAISIRVRGSKA